MFKTLFLSSAMFGIASLSSGVIADELPKISEDVVYKLDGVVQDGPVMVENEIHVEIEFDENDEIVEVNTVTIEPTEDETEAEDEK